MSRVLALVADLAAAPLVAARVGPPSPSSRTRLAQIRAPHRVAQSAFARQLAALAATRLLGRRVASESIEEAAGGAGLRLADASGLALSIAHSRERVAVAVGTAPLGVDVEYCDPRRDCLALARYACSPTEVEWLECAATEERVRRFYLLWTLREAAFKAGLRTTVLRGEPCLEPLSTGVDVGWRSRQLGSYRVSVATCAPVSIEWLGVAGAELVPVEAAGLTLVGPADAPRSA